MLAFGGTVIVKLSWFSRIVEQGNNKRGPSMFLSSKTNLLAHGTAIATQLVSGNQDWSQHPGLLFHMLV